jgi:hypothetical protein
MQQVREAQAEYNTTHVISSEEHWPDEVATSMKQLRIDARLILEAIGDNPDEIEHKMTNRRYPYLPSSNYASCRAYSSDGTPIVGDFAHALFPAGEADLEWILGFLVDSGYEVERTDDPTPFHLTAQSPWGTLSLGRTYLGDPDTYTLRINSTCAELS